MSPATSARHAEADQYQAGNGESDLKKLAFHRPFPSSFGLPMPDGEI
jgi:hypothetical protein